ncbi:hypothetical protein BBJ28_00005387 [Nothophytophthora sp. Chile5]|nr:hypothetical protein BBJ28_00005387 [Nothophytophthora sp. Chile5]
MGLQQTQQQFERMQQHKKKVKGCLVVPQDDDCVVLQRSLRSPSQSFERTDPFVSSQGPAGDDRRGERLASSRVLRDGLMHQMEALLMQETELSSAFELLEYTRQKCAQQHSVIVERLESYEELLHDLETQGASNDSLMLSQEERVKWENTKEMVTTVLPQLLERLEDNIALNNAKIRGIRSKMEQLRAQRLALREQIALKEEDIAIVLAE